MANGVTKYGVAILKVYFPNSNFCCGECPFLDKDRAGRLYCPMTKMVVDDLELMNFRCPLEIVEVDKTNNFEDV